MKEIETRITSRFLSTELYVYSVMYDKGSVMYDKGSVMYDKGSEI